MSINNSASPHFWWLISILGIAIIALVSYILTDKVLSSDKIMEYISFASVILSIILSVFAILYTYTSNVQIQQQFEKINTAANNITVVSDNLTKTENKLNENLATIINRLKSIDDRQEIMSGQVKNLNTKLNSNDSNITNVPSNNLSNIIS